jgi:nucleoside-specific outer membrane channel protein Tsx
MYQSLVKNLTRLTLALIALGFFAAPVMAGSATWSSTNIQYLYGSNFELGDNSRSTITVEHANNWNYGDNFFFVDITNPARTGDQTQTEAYVEFNPRFSLNKILNQDLSFGPVSEVLIATGLEMGNGFHNYLYGLGVSLKIPKFAFAHLNVYVRDNPNEDGVTYQFTPAWRVPFSIGTVDFVFKGFADIAGSEGNKEFNIDFQPVLQMDLGKFVGAPKQLYGGIEYIYWYNKFGVDGVHENAPQAMIEWLF